MDAFPLFATFDACLDMIADVDATLDSIVFVRSTSTFLYRLQVWLTRIMATTPSLADMMTTAPAVADENDDVVTSVDEPPYDVDNDPAKGPVMDDYTFLHDKEEDDNGDFEQE